VVVSNLVRRGKGAGLQWEEVSPSSFCLVPFDLSEMIIPAYISRFGRLVRSLSVLPMVDDPRSVFRTQPESHTRHAAVQQQLSVRG
jgi:hypothetical protein